MQLKKRWLKRNYPCENCTDDLNGLDCSSILIDILKNRGIDSVKEAEDFINSGIEGINDPYLIPDMKPAVELISRHINEGSRIVIYGDYDTDGITSTSIMYMCLKSMNANVDYYIPDRVDEGYGLNIDALENIIGSGCKLIITVDCGIASIEEVKYCKGKGIDIIITDHHECKEYIPETMVLNPKRKDSTYPFKDLAGVGVAFKLIQGLKAVYGNINPYDYVDLAAIGTIADVVPLTHENRIIVKCGLKAIGGTKNFGIKALFQCAGVSLDGFNSGQISFGIVPRINAIGRISDAGMGVKLFTSENMETALKYGETINGFNRNRQDIEDGIFTEAEKQINDKKLHENNVLVLYSQSWHIGVIGIVASRLVEKYYKPVIMLCGEGEILRGSARSIPGFNIFKCFSELSSLLEKFGGHEMAAGLSIKISNLDEFIKKANALAAFGISRADGIPAVYYDCTIQEKDITYKLAEELTSLEPYGMGNPVPSFLCEDCEVLDMRTVGASDKHLKMKLAIGTQPFDAIAFNKGSDIHIYHAKSHVDIICNIEVNTWGGRKGVNLVIRDMRCNPFRQIEGEYYRSLKGALERLISLNRIEDIDGSKWNIIPMDEQSVIERTYSNNHALILASNEYTVKKLLEYSTVHEILFETDANKIDDLPAIIINPDMERIDLSKADEIYSMDFLTNFKYINSYYQKAKNGVKLYMCGSSPEMDIEFINKIKPSREDVQKVYNHIKKLGVNGVCEDSVFGISARFSMRTVTVYFILKILLELGNINIKACKNNRLQIKIISPYIDSCSTSPCIRKLETLAGNIKNIHLEEF